MFKKYLAKYLILILLVFLIPSSYAAERKMTVSVATSTGLVCAGEVALYGYSMIATAAGGSVGLHDDLTSASMIASTNIKSEHQEATQYNGEYIAFDEPILFDNGLYANINNADVILYYKK